jgi:hypothetical protein
MQEIFGLTGKQLGGAVGATDLSDLFKPNTVSGVPEPASWALMLGGFGLVGGAMRRRRVAMRLA